MTETSSKPIQLHSIPVKEDPIEPADREEPMDEEPDDQEGADSPDVESRAMDSAAPAAATADEVPDEEGPDLEDRGQADPGPQDTDQETAEAEAEAVEAEAVEPEPGDPEPGQLTGSWPVQQQVPVQARRVVPSDGGPLLTDTEELAASWSRVKAGFVDNPRGSVAQAANLIEDAAETLVAALRARQDRMRDSWDRDGRDTESLRQALLTYQALFNRISDL